MRIVGFDPGLTGAAAAIDIDVTDIFGSRPKIKFTDIIDMPLTDKRKIDPFALRKWLRIRRPDFAILEDVHTMPHDGRVGAFNFGRGLGIVETTLRLCDLEPEMVTPQAWKKRFSLINQAKDAGRLRAAALVPDAAKWLQRIKDGGRGDSLLIALYGAEKILGRKRIESVLKSGALDASNDTRVSQ